MATAEIIETDAEVTVRPEPQFTLFGTQDPALVVQKATETSKALISVVEAQKLYTNISGKKYPRVEAWTLLGSMLGVFPVLKWTKPLVDNAGWEARVEAHTMAGVVVGAAESMCDRQEDRWRNADDHAVRSMAQTRATSKALGMPLRFVMVLSGFEGTPAEEMPSTPSTDWQPVSVPSANGGGSARSWDMRHDRDGSQAPGPPCPTDGCTGHLRQFATKKGQNPGSPYLVCDTGKNGCGLTPIWDTTIEDYRTGEEELSDVTVTRPAGAEATDVDYILTVASSVSQEELMEAFSTGALIACLSKKGKDWTVEREKIEHAPQDRLKAARSVLELQLARAGA